MKKVLTLLMLALTLAAFSQNTTKVVILDTYNRGGKIRQSTLEQLKTDLVQIFSETPGVEGVINEKVNTRLLAEGFAEHPRLSEEQAEMVAKLSDTQYALMSSASCDNFGYLSIQALLIDLDAYQVMASEVISMNNVPSDISKGCEKLAKKIIGFLPKSEIPIAEEDKEPPMVASKGVESADKKLEYAEPLKPQQLTSLEAEKVSRLLNHADVCIEMNYIDEAIKKYDEIVAIAPGWANAYMYLGNTYVMKGDASSLEKAKENYRIFMKLTDDQDLYFEAKDKFSRVEMMTELKAKEDENAENLVGVWKSKLYDQYTGRPWFVVDISKTSIPNKYQIILSSKSMMYNSIVNTKAYSDVIDGKISWSYTFQDTYIPSQGKYNMEGALVNYLFESGSLASLIGNVLVESARESDVGYTNILDFDFIADVNLRDVQDEYYRQLSDKFLEGSCQMKGEHHQAGRNNVEMDTVRECDFLRGDALFPVFVKVKEIGGDYYYGDIKLGGKNSIIDYSPYISQKEYEEGIIGSKTGFIVSGVFLSASGGVLLAGLLFNGVNKVLGDPAFFGKTFFATTGVISGVSLIGCIISNGQKNSFMKKLYSKHNQQVDENIRKYGRRDQANVSVNVGLTPTGMGISMNF